MDEHKSVRHDDEAVRVEDGDQMRSSGITGRTYGVRSGGELRAEFWSGTCGASDRLPLAAEPLRPTRTGSAVATAVICPRIRKFIDQVSDHPSRYRLRLSKVQRHDGFCAGFRTPACRTYPRARAAGVRKAPRHEIAVGGALAVPRALWGIERGVGLKENDTKRLSPWLRSKAWVLLQG